MPLIQGSISFRLFRVEGEPPASLRRAFEGALRRHAFRPVAVEKGETRSIGWVNPRQVLDADVTMDSLQVGPWILLAQRQDRLALNARLFRAQRDLAISEAAAKAKKTRLSKNERKAVEEQVRLNMLRRQTPSTQIIEAAWRPEDGCVYVAASSDAAALAFTEMFAVTFGLSLIPAAAAVRASRWAERHGVSDLLAELTPTVFAARPPKQIRDHDT